MRRLPSMPWVARVVTQVATRSVVSGLVSLAALTGCAVPPPGAGGLAPAPPPFAIASGDPLLERNKANVLAFYDLMFNQSQPALAMQRYGGATYTQHNPEVPDGREAFIAFFEQMARDDPGKRVIFKRIFAEGNYVTLHAEHVFTGWRGGRWAAIDIFRLDDDGKVVEHWDAIQKVPARAAHSNGMF